MSCQALKKQTPANITRLTGVPLEFADKLAAKGFSVIVDAKGLDVNKTRDIREKIQMYERLKVAKPATAVSMVLQVIMLAKTWTF